MPDPFDITLSNKVTSSSSVPKEVAPELKSLSKKVDDQRPTVFGTGISKNPHVHNAKPKRQETPTSEDPGTALKAEVLKDFGIDHTTFPGPFQTNDQLANKLTGYLKDNRILSHNMPKEEFVAAAAKAVAAGLVDQFCQNDEKAVSKDLHSDLCDFINTQMTTAEKKETLAELPHLRTAFLEGKLDQLKVEEDLYDLKDWLAPRATDAKGMTPLDLAVTTGIGFKPFKDILKQMRGEDKLVSSRIDLARLEKALSRHASNEFISALMQNFYTSEMTFSIKDDDLQPLLKAVLRQRLRDPDQAVGALFPLFTQCESAVLEVQDVTENAIQDLLTTLEEVQFFFETTLSELQPEKMTASDMERIDLIQKQLVALCDQCSQDEYKSALPILGNDDVQNALKQSHKTIEKAKLPRSGMRTVRYRQAQYALTLDHRKHRRSRLGRLISAALQSVGRNDLAATFLKPIPQLTLKYMPQEAFSRQQDTAPVSKVEGELRNLLEERKALTEAPLSELHLTQRLAETYQLKATPKGSVDNEHLGDFVSSIKTALSTPATSLFLRTPNHAMLVHKDGFGHFRFFDPNDSIWVFDDADKLATFIAAHIDFHYNNQSDRKLLEMSNEEKRQVLLEGQTYREIVINQSIDTNLALSEGVCATLVMHIANRLKDYPSGVETLSRETLNLEELDPYTLGEDLLGRRQYSDAEWAFSIALQEIPSSAEGEGRDDMAEGRKLAISDKKLFNAKDLLSEFLKTHPKDKEAKTTLGLVNAKLGGIVSESEEQIIQTTKEADLDLLNDTVENVIQRSPGNEQFLQLQQLIDCKRLILQSLKAGSTPEEVSKNVGQQFKGISPLKRARLIKERSVPPTENQVTPGKTSAENKPETPRRDQAKFSLEWLTLS